MTGHRRDVLCWVVAVSGALLISCCSCPREYIKVSSLDGKQWQVDRVAEVFWRSGTNIDNQHLEEDMEHSTISLGDFRYYSKYLATPKPGDAVFTVMNRHYGFDYELTIVLIGEVTDSISTLYMIERAEDTWCWKADSIQAEIRGEGSKDIVLRATMRSVGFALSSIVEFPTNEDGLYDVEDRFLRIEAQFRAETVSKPELWGH